MPTAWTRPRDVTAVLRKRWQSGALLTRFLSGQDWDLVSVSLRRPAAHEVGERLAEVRDWVAEWDRAGQGPLRVEHQRIGGRHLGFNTIPCRAWIDGYDQAWTILGVRPDAERLANLSDATSAVCPRVHPWLLGHPMKVLRLEDRWDKLLETVRWIDERQVPGMYLRQVDVPGVDTKFIEQHRGVLAELLDLQLDPERLDYDAGDFEGRYRFRGKPSYVRFRFGGLNGFSELSVRADELYAAPGGVARVYVVENEITYLAFPCPPDAMVIWGRGYAVPMLERLTWLRNLDAIYWGDIDTHGFAILDRLRQRIPHVRSMLMDRVTLLAHRSQWVTESDPSAVDLDLLNADEAALYRDLVADALGPSVRLEQERVSFTAVERALLFTAARQTQ